MPGTQKKNVSAAVIPVAGTGTRMLPATRALPKEILPVHDRPMVQYAVEEAIAAGIKTIILVTNSSLSLMESHFGENRLLEQDLVAKGRPDLATRMVRILPDDVTLATVRQCCATGLGHAILSARSLLGGQPFAVLLADVLMDSGGRDSDLSGMIARYDESGCSQILVQPVPESRVSNYGIVDVDQSTMTPGGATAIAGIVEKPAEGQAPSCMAVTGRYVLSPAIHDALENTRPGANGEVQLTDAIQHLQKAEPVEARYLTGTSFDCGSRPGWLEANLHFALRDDALDQDHRNRMLSLLAENHEC